MGKFFLICALIILGLFAVLMINNSVTKVKPVTQKSILNLSSASPTPTPAIINSMPNQTTPSAEIKAASAIIKTSRGDIELKLFSKDAPNTVENFLAKAKSGFYNNLIFHH